MNKLEVGTHQFKKEFSCFDCALNFYNSLEGKKYLMDTYKNKLILNTYGWIND